MVGKIETQSLKGKLNNTYAILPEGIVIDENYTHTDNNYTDEDKQKLISLQNYDDEAIQQHVIGVEEIAEENTNDISNLSNRIDKNEEELLEQEQNISHLDDIKADKENTFTKREVEELIANIKTSHFQVVEDLPEIGQENVIYLIHKIDQEFDDIFDEYVWMNNAYEMVGSTKVDLSNCVMRDELASELLNYVTTGNLIGTLNNFYTKSVTDEKYEPKFPNSYDYGIQSISYGNGESGYKKYKNGLLEQWGVATSSANGDTEFILHQPYRDTNFSIFVEPREMGNFYHYAIPSANQKFRARIQSRDSISMAVKFQWRGFGYWK